MFPKVRQPLYRKGQKVNKLTSLSSNIQCRILKPLTFLVLVLLAARGVNSISVPGSSLVSPLSVRRPSQIRHGLKPVLCHVKKLVSTTSGTSRMSELDRRHTSLSSNFFHVRMSIAKQWHLACSSLFVFQVPVYTSKTLKEINLAHLTKQNLVQYETTERK